MALFAELGLPGYEFSQENKSCPAVILTIDRIRAVLLAAAVFAFEAGPDGIELVHCGFDQSGFICQDACLEVAVAWAFHSQTCAGEICRADVDKLEVKDNQFEVYSGAQNPLQSGKQYWIMVEILPEFRAWFLGMDETDFTPFADQVGKYAQERTLADIQVLLCRQSRSKDVFSRLQCEL